MNLRQLQTLIIIADAGGLARAAGRLRLPPRGRAPIVRRP